MFITTEPLFLERRPSATEVRPFQEEPDSVSTVFERISMHMTAAMSSRAFDDRGKKSNKEFYFTQLAFDVGYDLERKGGPPEKMLATMLQAVDGLLDPIGDNAYSSVENPERRQRYTEAKKSLRRSDSAIGQYLLLREWSEYIHTLASAAPDALWKTYFQQW